MTTAADLLQALRARMPGKLILDRRTGLPYGWATWMSSRIGPAAAFDDDQVMGVLLARPALPASAGVALLSPFQAFRSLWWQHWEPRPKDQRPQHWLALLGSLLIHLGFIALLIWVVTVRWAPDETKTGDESRVRMTFIGDGAAEQGGGQGQPTKAAQAASGDAASAPQSSASAVTAATGKPNGASAAPPETAPVESVDPPSSAAQAQDIAPEPVAAAASEPVPPEVPRVTVQVPPVTIESPLQLTETPVATNDFVVPPPPTITVAPRPVEPAAPQIEVRQRDVQTMTEQPQLRELQRPAATVAMRTANAPTVREREIVVPDRPQVVAPSVRSREITPTVRMPEVAIRTAELPSVPDPAPQPAPAAPVQQTPATPAPTSVAAATQPAAASTQPNQAKANPERPVQPRSTTAAASSAAKTATSNAGPAPADRSGGWDVAANADDWSKSDRRRSGETTGADGARNGMFNADGSVRVAAGAGDAGNGAGDRGPPGSETDTWTRDQIAQGGTWLKRPPYGYTPTSLDKYWMPNQSLLQEWVRRGLKKIEIPIPGTTTKISCVVSLLQFGGGCGLSDPNLNDQPATARPPPDVPFKRELQEDSGAVR
ncbi:transmembrane repetitive protein [Xanthomonas arboricola]|uniref:transmembrane repetitive protein n=1 Tax=Xanthomonas arboricola TaxID=56448 RepID=UPI0032E8AFF8